MNILGRNLLSLTVYHLRRAIRIVIGSPVVDGIVVNPDGSVAVGGSGGTPGQTIVITFPDGSVGTGVVGSDGGWSVTSPGAVTPVPAAPDLVVDQVPTPATPTTPEPGEVKPGEGGGTVVGGGGATPGDDVEVTLPGGETGSGEADGDGDWEVEFPDVPFDPDLDPGDIGVGTSPQPGNPVVEDVAILPDGSVIVSGSGAKPGDVVTVTLPDGTTGSSVADDNGNWSVFLPDAQGSVTGPGDVTVGAQPDPMAGSVSAPDAVYVDIAGMEFVEVDDNGNYLAWEQFVEQIKRIVGVATEPGTTASLGYQGGFVKGIVKIGSTFLATFDNQTLIFDSEQDLVSNTPRTVEKNYLHNGHCGVFKTLHTAYYLRLDGGRNRLVRFDGTETNLVFDVINDNVPDIVSLGEADWLYNSDFTLSYLINPVTLEITDGPTFNDIRVNTGRYSGWATAGAGRTFVTATSTVTDYEGVYEINTDGTHDLLFQSPGEITAGDKYLYVKNGISITAINLEDGSSKEVIVGSALLEGYSRGDFAIFRNESASTSVTVTYDGGNTFANIFVTESDASLMQIDVEGDKLVLTRNYREFDLLEYQLIEQ